MSIINGSFNSVHGRMIIGQMSTRQMLTNKVGDWTNALQEKINERKKYIKEVNINIKLIIFIYRIYSRISQFFG